MSGKRKAHCGLVRKGQLAAEAESPVRALEAPEFQTRKVECGWDRKGAVGGGGRESSADRAGPRGAGQGKRPMGGAGKGSWERSQLTRFRPWRPRSCRWGEPAVSGAGRGSWGRSQRARKGGGGGGAAL